MNQSPSQKYKIKIKNLYRLFINIKVNINKSKKSVLEFTLIYKLTYILIIILTLNQVIIK